ncbi:MAG: Ig-like domain-containing protein [Ruminococcus flavefaciens]|nr:Ig-like domain-containing protein [Ruminococcus flavefaciens]MCM1228993.1 Ig-like domain-containing protein [Ruminococcus flavefaciens]
MKTKEFLASVMSAALGITTVLSIGLSEPGISAVPFVAYADDEEYTLGDVNGDNAIDAGDASIVLAEYSVLSIGGDGTFKKNQRKSADVDKNNIINSADATLILAYYSYTSTGGKLDMQSYLDERNNQQSVTTTTTPKTTSTSSKTTTTAVKTTTTAKSTTTTKKTTSTTTTKSTATTTKTTATTTSTSTSATTASTTVSSTTTTTVTTDPYKVSAIRLTRTEMQIKAGCGELSAYVTMLPETASNKGERWSSSDESIAVVDSEGWVIARKAGKCLITVHSIDNPDVSATVRVTVYDDENPPESTTTSTTATTASTTTTTETTVTSNIKVEEIRLSKYEMTIPVGKEDISMVTMLPYDAINKDEIWISSDEKIATVNKYGWVNGASVGECIVTVYSVSNPAIKAEIAVKVVPADTEVPDPDINFSYVIGDKSDDRNLAFYTPFPKNASGRFVIDYVITNSNGTVRTISTTTLLAPEMSSVITMLTADTNSFTVEEYITNLATNERAKIGKYSLSLIPRNASSLEEDITSAFSLIHGLGN